MNTNEPSFLQLLDWIEGRLSDEDAAAIALSMAHSDPETQNTVEWMRAFQSVSARTVLKQLPQQHHQNLVRLFREQAEDEKKPGFLQSLLATLTFDSRWQMATAGVRALSGLGNQRQMVFSTDAADLIINTQPCKGGSQMDMLGQVMPTNANDTAPCLVQLLQNDAEFRSTHADELGEFTFETIPPGSYTIFVSMEKLEIQTPLVELKLV